MIGNGIISHSDIVVFSCSHQQRIPTSDVLLHKRYATAVLRGRRRHADAAPLLREGAGCAHRQHHHPRNYWLGVRL